MFNLKVSTIRERTTNGPTYMNGRTCYRNGQVEAVSFDSDKGLIQARVEGTQPYQVRIILNGEGGIHDTSCTCSAFTSYWGDCKHIAAVLLHCVDHFGNGKVDTSPQQVRKSRVKAREFLNQTQRRAQMALNTRQEVLKLNAIIYCGNNPSTLPFLTLSIVNSKVHPVSNLEQFVDAIARDLPIEIDEHLTVDPFCHQFDPSDEPLLNMLLDAYEHDYKASFGSAMAARSERQFVLNAWRTAAFLRLAADQPHYRYSTLKGTETWPIKVQERALPIRLLLKSGESDEFVNLIRQEGPTLLQLTASRNVYLVDDTFYLPSRESIRALEPVLSIFSTPGIKNISLSAEEAADLIGLPESVLEAVCPVDIDPQLSQKLIRQPLISQLLLSSEQDGLKGELNFHYGSQVINPLSNQTGLPQLDGQIIIRQKLIEQKIISILEHDGFRRQGQAFRLNEQDAINRFLDSGFCELEQLSVLILDRQGRAFQIMPAPVLTAEVAASSDSQDLELILSWGDMSLEDRAIYIQALRDQKPYSLNRQGRFRQVNPDSSQLLILFNLLEDWGIKPTRDRQILPRYRILLLAELSDSTVRIDSDLRQIADSLKDLSKTNYRVPQAITVSLRPYQKLGFHWLCTLDHYGLGGILADDMGLGKTLQAITYIAYNFKKKKRPALVIAPTSLVYNWQREFEKFAPDLPVMVFDGNRQQRTARLDSIQKKACVITSYSLVRRDYLELAEFNFSSCFLDEAQNIKNPETLNARSVKQIKADRTFALTGTPIENSLVELWSIFDFLLPGYLSSRRRFETRYDTSNRRELDPELLEDLHKQIAPFVLRRMKKDVLTELPDKIETRMICEMTTAQRQLYEDFLHNARKSFEQEVAVNGFVKSQLYILALLTRLRQICCHPSLFLNDYDEDSGKLLLLDELIADALDGGHRILIFSQFAQMLQIIRARLLRKGLTSFLIDGQVAADERLEQVDRFNNGEGSVFLISLRAGGTGLNLTGADTVIHYDPWWNPAVEDQATDRAYRMGQENIVQVFKLYARDTLEEKIQALQEQKQALIKAVIKPGQNLLSQMTVDEVRSLFDP